MNYSDKIESLSNILPMIAELKDQTVVIKYGGAAMQQEELTRKVIKDLIFLSTCNINIVLVHGGGPVINKWLRKLEIEPQFNNGIRITDKETMEVVEIVLSGKVNKKLVGLINSSNGKAVGLSGKDGNILIADPTDLSFQNMVGKIKFINTDLLNLLINNQYIPVISPVASDYSGQSYNINADTVAGEIASALCASKLLILTDTPGILTDFEDASTLIPHLTINKINDLIQSGIITGGMLPKVDCCMKALAKGVKSSSIIDGRVPHSVLLNLLTDENIGSTITL